MGQESQNGAMAETAGRGTNLSAPRGCLLPALLSALLLGLSFYPVGWGWLGWIALVPLLCLVRSTARSRQVYAAAWICGLLFFFPILSWLRLADDRLYDVGISFRAGNVTWIGLATACSLFIPLAIFLLRRLERNGWPLVLSLPVAWTACEYVRAHVGTGFPWYFLGHTQHGFLPLIQIADLGGAYGVTFLVAAVNAVLFEMLCQRAWFRCVFALPELAVLDSASRRHAMPTSAWVVLASLALALLYGAWRLGHEDFEDGPLVAMLQGNIPQSLRNAAVFSDEQRDSASQTARQQYGALGDDAAKNQPHLIVWPETSLPEGWGESTQGDPDFESKRVANLFVQRWQCHVLLGTNSYIQTEDPQRSILYNSAVLVGPGETRFLGRYDKVHRVPFGEYVPWLDTIPLLKTFAPYDYDYSIRPGDELKRFTMPEASFGVLICFEDTDPYLARQYVRSDRAPMADRLTRLLSHGMYNHLPSSQPDSRPVDFLVNISNDAWFDGSAEHDEHLAVCRFRAVECRRAIIRSVNMGISAVIDGSGRVIALPAATWAGSKKMQAALVAEVPLDRRGSLYAAYGDWLPALCFVLAGFGAVGLLGRKFLLRLVNAFESWNVFHPVSAARDWFEPASAGLRAEDVELVSADGTKLHGWWCPGPDDNQKHANGAPSAILFLHGNAGNLSHRAYSILEWQHFQHLPAFIVDYPGYGRSQGKPSEKGCYDAAFAAYDWLINVKKVPPERILLYGDSLGGGVAMEVALARPHHALIIVRSFTSIVDMAKMMFPFLPVADLILHRFDNAAKIVYCQHPIFIAHGDCDRLVPFDHGEQLFALAPQPKRFFRMRGCDHNDALGEDFHLALRDFLREIQPQQAGQGAEIT